ncbi:MAG: hypothetical protein ACE5IC_01260 [Candidatus Brocadiales bacterium]
MRTPLYAVLAVLFSGCGTFSGGGDTQARLDAMEQQMAVVIERIGTIEESNEEIMGKVEELARDTSTSQRLTLLEEKQASAEKMQLEVISHQESLKSSMAKMRKYIEALERRVDEQAKKQQAQIAERRRKHLEERLRQQVEEEARIQEIPRKSIIKIEKPPAKPKMEQKPTSSTKIEAAPAPPKKRKPALIPPKKKEEPKGGFILEDF